jgi:hypothetical protein
LILLSIVPAAGEENFEHPTSSHSRRRCCITTGVEPFCSHALGAIDSAPQARNFGGHRTERITSPPQAFNDRPAAGEENFEPLESWRCNHPQLSPLSLDNKSPCALSASAQRRCRNCTRAVVFDILSLIFAGLGSRATPPKRRAAPLEKWLSRPQRHAGMQK